MTLPVSNKPVDVQNAEAATDKPGVQLAPKVTPGAFSFNWQKVSPIAKAAFAFLAVSFVVGLIVKAIIILPAIVVGMICVGGYLLSAQKISEMVKNQAQKA